MRTQVKKLTAAALAAVCLPFVGTVCLADDEIEKHLASELLSTQAAFKEMSAFCLTKVSPLPAFEKPADWQAHADRLRRRVLDEIVLRGEGQAWNNAKTRVEWLDTIEGGPGYRIRKLRYEALPGFWIPALLYEPEKLSGRVPVTLHPNGHTSEGNAYAPKQIRCINLAKRGMLALSTEFIGMGQLGRLGYTHYRMNQLDLCGTSGVAPFYLALKRAVDLLLALPQADPERMAVAGLSGGGWQTILISALDERVTLANPVAGYSGLGDRAVHPGDVGDSEQLPTDLGLVADYTTLTAMRAPRPTLLTYNAQDDCCFTAGWALPTLRDAAQPIYRLFQRENALRWHVNHDPGTHNFLRDNREAFYQALGDFFYPDDKGFSRTDIPSEGEVKTAEQLRVPLPEPSEDFHTLALRLSRALPRREWRMPDQAEAARRRLGELVRTTRYNVAGEQVSQEKMGDVLVRRWRLRMGDAWTVPAVEFEPSDPRGVTIIAADDGRKSLAEEVRRRLARRERVIALDPFDFGESIAWPGVHYPLLVAALGERPLGIEAAQLAAAVGWGRERQPRGEATLAAVGPRTALAACIASALGGGADGLELLRPLASLRQLIDDDRDANLWPDVFCFGLLEEFEMKTILALVTAREITIRGAEGRLRVAFADLAASVRAAGKSFKLDED
ncbi:MAG TPA: hypothetical protein VF278_17865 [Pirellulales bacterium]